MMPTLMLRADIMSLRASFMICCFLEDQACRLLEDIPHSRLQLHHDKIGQQDKLTNPLLLYQG